MKIKFGTDGWRAIIGHQFTTDNVCRLTAAVAQWLIKNNIQKPVVVGYDSRFNGDLFAEAVVKTLTDFEIKCYMDTEVVTTPMVSLAAKRLNCALGIVITASHNPYSYSGYKIKSGDGGPLQPHLLAEIEELVIAHNTIDLDSVSLSDLQSAGLLEFTSLKSFYLDAVNTHFNMPLLRQHAHKVAFDAMFGAGQFVFSDILPNAKLFRAQWNPRFPGISPEPIPKNLHEYFEFVKQSDLDLGICVDGDADRIAFVDAAGNYIDSHHVMLLLVHYLAGYKHLKGEVATGFSTTVKLAKLCAHYNIPITVVPIGFKHVSKLMLEKTILMGGEESGGIAILGHIPERDGIWNGLTLLQATLESGKSINQLIDEVYAITGAFAYHRIDYQTDEITKQKVLIACENGGPKKVANRMVDRVDRLDGFKFIIDVDTWVMVRASGTEPLLRTYAEAKNKEEVNTLLEGIKRWIDGL